MAFSTQKGFFDVPFMNESYEQDCKKACVKLKSYDSTIDTRSWANDEAKQSRFLSDLVTCQYPSNLNHNEGERNLDSSSRHLPQSQRNVRSTADVNAHKGASTSKYNGQTRNKKESDNDDSTIPGNEETLALQLGGDSLLECANFHLAEYQKVLKINTSLEKQLDVSRERLRTANEENKKIREILSSKLDSNTAKDFYNKIQKFTAAGKFNKNEENVMLQFYQKMENMNRNYETLQAENNYLKRLIEKLTARVTLENITTDPEQSEDIGYLHNEINSLRKECVFLRQIEDDYQIFKQQQTNKSGSISEQDAESIKTIIKERNSLREKCKSLKALEQQVKELEHKTQEAKKETVDLCSSLNSKTKCINEMEVELQKMQKHYEEKCQNASLREECLKAQLDELKEELIQAKCHAQKADLLCMEVSSLRNEVLKRDLSLKDYDCQYKQLMDVVNELQSVKLECLHDNQTQTCIDQTDELAFYTSATLNGIMKELQKRGCFNEEPSAVDRLKSAPGGSNVEYNKQCYQEKKRMEEEVDEMRRGYFNDEFSAVYRLEPAPGGSNDEYDKQCCQEMKRLQQEVEEMRKEKEDAVDCDKFSADAHKRLKELERENTKLLQDNQVLNEKLREGEAKMINMLQKIENLDKDISRNSQEANKIGKDLQGAIDLVKDISELQLKNQQLANAVSTINSRDDEKIIEDLRRQLEEEMGKLKKCQQNNTNLLEEAKLREMDLKELKELNNKLLHDNANLKKIINLTQSEEIDESRYVEEDNLRRSTTNYYEEKKQQSHTPSKDTMSKNTNRSQQKVVDLDEYVTSPLNNAASKPPSRIKQEVASLRELVTSSSKDAVSKQPIQMQHDVIDDLVTSPSKNGATKQASRIQKDIVDLDEFVTPSTNNVASKHPSQIKQEVESLDDFVTYPSKDNASKQPSRTQHDVADLDEFVIPPPNDVVNKQPSRIKQEAEILDEFVTFPYKDGATKQPSRTQPDVGDLEEFVISSSKETASKQPSRLGQEVADIYEFVTSPSKEAISKNRSRIKQEETDLDEFVTYPSTDAVRKHPSQTNQKTADLYEFVKSPSKDSASKQPKHVQQKQQKRAHQKDADLDEFVKSPSKGGASKQPKRTHPKGKAVDESRLDASNKQSSSDQQKLKALNQYASSVHKDSLNKHLSREHQKEVTLDDFVNKKSDTLKYNLQKGRCFEKEFRNILEEFIFECSNCFCRSFNMKSKLYDICHRLCHRGIDTLTFRELAYLHRKIYAQADQLIPGCLLDMILSDHKEQIERMLTSVAIPHSVDNKEIDCKVSDENISSVDQKCCCCKSELCCSYSEEMLKDKVNKLEKDIGIAREYLETLRHIPIETNVTTDNGDSSDTNNSTYRASTTVMMQQKSRYSKHLKKLKSRMIKHPAI